MLFMESRINGATVDTTSQICTAAILLLFLVGS